MAHLTISVPEQYVGDLRRELLRAHAQRAAALQRALDAYLESHERLDDVEGALVELADLDAALSQLGWVPDAPPRAAALTAHPEVLGDALRAALAARGEPSALLALLRVVEGGH